MLEWALGIGKIPERAEGYAESTVKNRAYRIDQFFWIWSGPVSRPRPIRVVVFNIADKLFEVLDSLTLRLGCSFFNDVCVELANIRVNTDIS